MSTSRSKTERLIYVLHRATTGVLLFLRSSFFFFVFFIFAALSSGRVVAVVVCVGWAIGANSRSQRAWQGVAEEVEREGVVKGGVDAMVAHAVGLERRPQLGLVRHRGKESWAVVRQAGASRRAGTHWSPRWRTKTDPF